MRVFLCALLSATGLLLASCNESGTSGGGAVTPPPTSEASRAGLMYGYYGSRETQIAETADHVTLQWVSPWDAGLGPLEAIKARLREATAPVILDVPVIQFNEGDEQRVREYFDTLRADGLITGRIRALYMQDEVDLLGIPDATVMSTAAMLRRVAAEYPFPPGVELWMIYTSRGLWPGIAAFDAVGFDAYQWGAGVLTSATRRDMKARMRVDQKELLVPGAYQCDDAWAFYDAAQRDPQVLAIVAFIWFDEWAPGERGLRSQPCRQSYVDAALRIKTPR